jgi:hypothetical protein
MLTLTARFMPGGFCASKFMKLVERHSRSSCCSTGQCRTTCELATINRRHVVSGAADCDRAMGARVGRRANFGRVLINGEEASARGCG